MSSPRILVVEDNPITRKMLRVTLVAEGYTVLEAPDGHTALELMDGVRPDLVLTDLILPDVDGFDLVNQLRARPGGADIPILACSGFLSRFEAARMSALGFTDFLMKPVEPSRLVRTVRGLLPLPRAEIEAPGRGRHVLAVDDDPVQLKLMRIQLGQLGFRVTTASDGAEALEQARRVPPDAILSDVLMPHLDGFQLSLAVRQDPRLAHVPVVLISANYLEEADRALAEKIGASGLAVRTPDCKEAIEVLLASLRDRPPQLRGPAEALEEEHVHRMVRQLERQVAQNIGLIQRSSLQAAVLSMLATLSSGLAQRLEVEIAPSEVLVNLLDVGGLSLGALYLYGPDGRLRLEAQHGYAAADTRDLEDLCGHPELLQVSPLEGVPVTIPSAAIPPPTANDFLGRAGVKSALLVSLGMRGEPIGVLLLGSKLRDLADSDWRPFAQTVGGQISQTIALSRTFTRLTAAEEQYRALFEHALEGIFQASPAGALLLANPALARILGYASPEELVATVSDLGAQLYVDSDRRAEFLRQLEAHGAVSGFEGRACRKDGRVIWISLSARAVRDTAGRLAYVEGRMEDVTARKRAEEMASALSEVGRELVATRDFGQIAERVTSTMARVFQVSRAALYRLEPASGALTCVAAAGVGDDRNWVGQVLPPGAGMPGRAVAAGRPVRSSNVSANDEMVPPQWLVDRRRIEGLRTGAGAPLTVQGRTVGALGLADGPDRVFTDDELGLLSAFADQAAAALQNAQLYEEARRRRQAAEGLADLGRLVSQSLDSAEVRQRVVEGVCQLLGARSAALFEIEAESGDFVTGAASGELTELFPGKRVFARGTGASGLAVRERRPVVTTDLLADERLTVTAEDRAVFEQASCRAVIAVPLSTQERIVGVLHVAGLTGRVFDDEEVRLVQGFADQTAVALEHARLYEEARAARDFLQSIATNSADAIITTDITGRITYFSPGAEEVLGYAAGEMRGRDVAELYRTGRDEARAVMGRLRAQGRIRSESAFRAKDGRWVDMSASLSLLHDAEGHVAGTVGVLRDVTEQRRAADALRDSEERFRRAFDDSGIGMALQTLDGRYVLVNPAYCEMVGYTAPELLAMHFADVLHSEDLGADAESDRQMLAGELSRYQREKRYRHKTGRVVWVLSTVSLVRDSHGQPLYFIAQVQDVTERKQIEVELDQQREARLQSDKLAAMGQLLAGVAHELNNPLSVVIGRAALLSEALGGGPLAVRAEQIAQAAERGARIFNNFLALARQRPPERGTVHLNRVAQEAVELLAYPLRVDNVRVVLDLAVDLPSLWADGNQLHQVVVNLVTNAHQAMRESPDLRRLTLATRPDATRTHVVLEVADTGPGIPPTVLPRLFEPFFTTKPAGQGTGLGLSLCRGIVEEHGGSISVESANGHGARFRIELPVTTPVVEVEEPKVALRPNVPGKSILVVDDEVEVADILAEILAVDGHEVETAPNGRIALDRILEKPYDLVFSDMKMPELDGPGLYRRLEQLRHPLLGRFVFLTGDVLGAETRAFLERTGVSSVSKPFGVADIRRVLQQIDSREAIPALGRLR